MATEKKEKLTIKKPTVKKVDTTKTTTKKTATKNTDKTEKVVGKTSNGGVEVTKVSENQVKVVKKAKTEKN